MKNIVIVSGGGNGLGLELVKILHSKGYFVCNIDKDERALKNLEKSFLSNYKSFLGNVADEKFIISTIKKNKQYGEYNRTLQ